MNFAAALEDDDVEEHAMATFTRANNIRLQKSKGGGAGYASLLQKVTGGSAVAAVDEGADDDVLVEESQLSAPAAEPEPVEPVTEAPPKKTRRALTTQKSLEDEMRSVRRRWLERQESLVSDDDDDDAVGADGEVGVRVDAEHRDRNSTAEEQSRLLAATSPGKRTTAPSKSSGGAVADVEGFTAASSFVGPRAGQTFKMGPHGLGYYADARVAAEMRAQATEAEAMAQWKEITPPDAATDATQGQEQDKGKGNGTVGKLTSLRFPFAVGERVRHGSREATAR